MQLVFADRQPAAGKNASSVEWLHLIDFGGLPVINARTFCLHHTDNNFVLHRNVRWILVRGSMPPCRLRRRKFRKFDYEMVHFELYLNQYVVSIAPFSTPACPDCSQNNYNIGLNIENCSFCLFSLFNFSSIFQQGDGLAGTICPYVRTPKVVHAVHKSAISFTHSPLQPGV